MRRFTLAIAAATMTVPAAMTLPAAPAEAQQRYYDRGGNYVGPTWRGRDGRYRCRRPNGTTGLIVGGAAGALIGREVAGRGDRDIGMILGAAAGALIGREVERGMARRRCR
ncbi:glycine zipper 2TM domain-containing protein [Sphingosinicella sp. YJ22]|uniref:glycine zipper 2TM domain-containing protein n=1 Tax=Sphingosinicella sp. YJ22 TaxID=1104780 RepID=UPI001407AD53|nr:glycine zipper 2TM domain-containing protein [Sphingosinicella sp. YJ22]